jgi:hypothetical protein
MLTIELDGETELGSCSCVFFGRAVELFSLALYRAMSLCVRAVYGFHLCRRMCAIRRLSGPASARKHETRFSISAAPRARRLWLPTNCRALQSNGELISPGSRSNQPKPFPIAWG